MSFRQFVELKITHILQNFQSHTPLLDSHGHLLDVLDLSLATLTDQFLKTEALSQNAFEEPKDLKLSTLKLCDKDIEKLLSSINDCWSGKLDLSGHNFGNETAIRLSKLLALNKIEITSLALDNNAISAIGGRRLGQALEKNKTLKTLSLANISLSTEGSNPIIEAIATNSFITDYNLGKLTNSSLQHLTKHLELSHRVVHLAFGQNERQPWTQASIKAFDRALRKNQTNNQLLSIQIQPQDEQKHFHFILETALFCKKNRIYRVKQRQDQYKSQALNTEHPKYYDPDNHDLNAYKFSVKSYLTNVFGSTLDESLYLLEKQRRNQLREQAIFKITEEVKNQPILEDICTADGSILVLAHFLLKKIKD